MMFHDVEGRCYLVIEYGWTDVCEEALGSLSTSIAAISAKASVEKLT
jgi:hypothetical protein